MIFPIITASYHRKMKGNAYNYFYHIIKTRKHLTRTLVFLKIFQVMRESLIKFLVDLQHTLGYKIKKSAVNTVL